MASAVAVSRSSVSSTRKNAPVEKGVAIGFVVCVDPANNDDLQHSRIYQVIQDASAARSRFLRVVDDSGEDYLYPASCFLPVDLPVVVQEALAKSLR
jgi:hypothetical protein